MDLHLPQQNHFHPAIEVYIFQLGLKQKQELDWVALMGSIVGACSYNCIWLLLSHLVHIITLRLLKQCDRMSGHFSTPTHHTHLMGNKGYTFHCWCAEMLMYVWYSGMRYLSRSSTGLFWEMVHRPSRYAETTRRNGWIESNPKDL